MSVFISASMVNECIYFRQYGEWVYLFLPVWRMSVFISASMVNECMYFRQYGEWVYLFPPVWWMSVFISASMVNECIYFRQYGEWVYVSTLYGRLFGEWLYVLQAIWMSALRSSVWWIIAFPLDWWMSVSMSVSMVNKWMFVRQCGHGERLQRGDQRSTDSGHNRPRINFNLGQGLTPGSFYSSSF